MPLGFQRDCSTCAYRTLPNDVDWSKEPCESCILLHTGGSKKLWPMWSLRSPAQFRNDAKAGFKVKLVLKHVTP